MDRAGAHRHRLIWAAAVPVALWAIVRCFGLERGFPLVPLIAYTPYIAVAALLAAGVALALRNWAAAALATVATVALLAAVLPRAFAGDAGPRRGAELAVLSANVHHGTADPEALIGLIRRRRPDVLCIQELTPSYARELAEAGIDELLPSHILSVREGAAGGGIYARLPLRDATEPQPYAFRMPRALLWLEGRSPVVIVDVHPLPPTRTEVEPWEAGMRSLPSAEGGAAWVLAGDFNATLDHAELRDLLERGYRDAADVTGSGLTPTWPAGLTRLPPVTIDHVLADRRFLGVAAYAVDELPGSDHRAVFARLVSPR